MSKKKNNKMQKSSQSASANNNRKNGVSEAQLKAIRRSYFKRSHQDTGDVSENKKDSVGVENKENFFPDKFPFWARLRFEKKRPTLVIDEDLAYDKQRNKMVDGYVHREVTHSNNKNTEKVTPNPDKNDSGDMFLNDHAKLLNICLLSLIWTLICLRI